VAGCATFQAAKAALRCCTDAADATGVMSEHRATADASRLSDWVSGNWRLTFLFEGEDAVLVDYQDYH
jgi:plasmid maintenance system killer protein